METIIYIMIFSIILTPLIKIGQLPAIRIEQLIVFLVLGIISGWFFLKKEVKIHWSILPLLQITFAFFIFISIVSGIFNGVKVSIRDFFEIYKIVIYTGVFLIIATYIKKDTKKLQILIFIRKIIFISSIIAIIQYFNIYNLNKYYIPIIAPTQYDTLVGNYPWPRVVGITPNPNIYAVLVGIGILICIGLYMETKQKKNLLFALIMFIALSMTRSRSGLVFLLCSLFIFVIFQYKEVVKGLLFINKVEKKSLKHFFILSFGLIVVILGFFLYAPDDLTWRFLEALNLSNSSSWQARLKHWVENWGYFTLSPIFGIGPAKSIDYKYAADNEWLLLLRMYGIFGTLYFVISFILPCLYRQIINSFYGKIYISVLVGAAIYMIPAAIYNSFQLMPLVMVLAGLAFSDESKVIKIKI